MKLLLIVLFFIATIPTHAQVADTLYSKGPFPESWDKNHDLRGTNSKVLAWVHRKDDRPFELKACITLLIRSDSLGKAVYCISEKYTNEKPFNKWDIGSKHHAPREGEFFGFHDIHLRQFDHKPSKAELYQLLNYWGVSLYKNGWRTIECGIDEQLWLDTFGFIPNRSFTSK